MSFTDSFLDFEAIKNWFESTPNPNMPDTDKPVTEGPLEVDSRRETLVQQNLVDGSEPISDGSGSVARVEDKEREMAENVSHSIEDDMGKVSLVGESVKSIDIISQSGANSKIMNGNDEKSEALTVRGEYGNLIDMGESGEEREPVTGEFGNSIGIGENCTNSEITDGNGEKSETWGDSGSKIDVIIDGDVEKSEAVNETTDGNGEKSKAACNEDDESESSESESESTSSSSSSSSGCSSSDDEDEEEEEKAGEVEEGEIRDINFRDVLGDDVEAMVDWSDVDDEDDGFKGPIRSKNESKFLPPVPPVDASLLPHHQTLPVGVILSIIGTQVVVEGIEEHSPLSDGSILWITESKAPLGLVDEIFGPVKNPYYIVRYNSEGEVPDGISIGDPVSFVPEFASHVLGNRDIYKKGYDASGANDEEVSDEAEFSDDEKEAEHRRALKASKRGTTTTAMDLKPRKNKSNKKNFESQPQPQLHPQPHFSPPPTLQPVWPNTPPGGAWPNAAAFQHPHGPFFNNGFPTNNNNSNNMMWAPPNSQQFPAYQMPLPMPMPSFIQQQVNPSQSVPFGQGFAGQNCFNPMPFGVGLQGQPSPLTTNGVPMLQNYSAPQSGGVRGSNNAPQQFNQGPHGGHGSGPYRRGGGRFSRGRGRKQ